MHIRKTGVCRVTVFSPLEQIIHYLEHSLSDHYPKRVLLRIALLHILDHLQEGDKVLLILHLPQHAQLVLLLILAQLLAGDSLHLPFE